MPQVHVERRDAVLIATLDNPPHNFMTTPMVGEIEGLVDRVVDDETIGAAIFTGRPEDIFITHFDVDEIAAGAAEMGRPISARQAGAGLRAARMLRSVPAAGSVIERTPLGGLAAVMRLHELFGRMERAGATFIAALNGTAMGGGFELALACDMRIAAEGAGPFALPEVTVGIIPGAGGTQRLARAVGASRAIELILDGRPLDAAEAAELGIVHEVVPAAELIDRARERADRLARRSPQSVAAAKRAVYGALDGSNGTMLEAEGFIAAASSPAARDAMTAYVARIAEADPDALDIPAELGRWREGREVEMRRPR